MLVGKSPHAKETETRPPIGQRTHICATQSDQISRGSEGGGGLTADGLWDCGRRRRDRDYGAAVWSEGIVLLILAKGMMRVEEVIGSSIPGSALDRDVVRRLLRNA
jgi:hypothetical protein